MWWIATGLLGCSRLFEAPTAPPRSALAHSLRPTEASTLVVPVSMPLQDLAAVLHETLPMTLVDKKNEPPKDGKGNLLLDLKVDRQGPPELTGLVDGTVRLSLPLNLKGRARRAKKAKGLPIQGKLLLKADLDIGVADDWRLDPKVEFDHEWIEKPKVKIAGIPLGIAKRVDKKLEVRLPEVAQKAEDGLRANDRLKQAINAQWGRLATPRATRGEPAGWFHLRPETVYVSRLRASPTALLVTVGLRGPAELGLGEPPTVDPGPLPPVTEPPRHAGLRLPIDVGFDWAELSKWATAALAERKSEFLVDGVPFDVGEVEIYPSGERIAVGVDYVLGSTDQTAWLLAVPELDQKARTLRLEEFDYVVETWDFAAAAANSELLRDRVRGGLSQYLEFDYGMRLDEAVAKANARLTQVDLPGGGHVKARLDKVEVRDVALRDEILQVRTSVMGDAEVELAGGIAQP